MSTRLRSLLFVAASLFAFVAMQDVGHAQRVIQTYNDTAAYPQPDPLYPYVAPQQSYGVPPQTSSRAYPYVNGGAAPVARVKKAKAPARTKVASAGDDYVAAPAKPVAPKTLKRVANVNASVNTGGKSKADPALIEELKQRAEKNPVIKKEIIVREKPVVVEHKRVVDDPPIVVTREHVIDEYRITNDRPRGLIQGNEKAQAAPAPAPVPAPLPPAAGQRVIRAEAEVTILGPDRMSIRLFRKAGEPAPPDLVD